jgi:hypothetical protein
MALTMLLLLLFLMVMLVRQLEDCCLGIHRLESETPDKYPTVCLLSSLLHLFPRLTPLLVANFVIGIIAVSLLGMGLLRLTKIHHGDIAFVAMVTVLFMFVLAKAIGAFYVSYHCFDTLREVLYVFRLVLLVHSPLFLSFSSPPIDQRDEHGTEYQKDREISTANDAVTSFRHCLLQKDLPTGLINFSCSLLIFASEGLGQETHDKRRGESRSQTQTRTISRPTIYLSLWFLLFSSSVHGITLNCINKTYPSSSCCSGEITLDPTMTTIAANAFDGCSGLTGSLTIPSSVTTIAAYAFRNCFGFTGSLTLLSSLTTIADYAFYLCDGFTGALTIPSSVTTIGAYAFTGCSGFIGSLTLPSSLTSIGYAAFNSCPGFTGSLTLPSSLTAIGPDAFSGCSGFTGSLTIPSSVTTIGDAAFAYCEGFNGSLTIPSSVTTIADSAFYSCSGFTGALAIPSSVTTIGAYSFLYCSGFTGSLTLPSSLTTIGAYSFLYCSGFTGSLIIPSSVTTIAANAFDGCSGLTGSLTLPSSLTTISNEAFRGCSNFTSAVTFPNSVTTLGSNVFAFNKCNWLSCCSNCTLTGAQMCLCDSPSCSGVCQTTFFPSTSPSIPFVPSSLSSVPVLEKYGFGVIFGDSASLGMDQAIIVTFFRDLERGESLRL